MKVEGLGSEAVAKLRRDGEQQPAGLRAAALKGLSALTQAVQRRRG